MTMDFFLGQLRLALVAALAYAGGRGWLTPTDSGFAVALITSLGPIVGPWLWSVYVNINGKIVPQHAMVVDPIITNANVTNPTATVQTSAGTVTGKVLGSVAVLMLAGLLWSTGALAQSPLSKLQQDIATAKATLANLNQQIATTGKAGTSTSSKPGACDITLFTNLTIASAVTDIQNCIGSVVAGGAAPFVTDITAALASATAAKDGTAISCLTPALAIAQAAQGTPDVPAVMSTDGTTVVTPEKPAVYPGPILIFQKYREFVTAGGPSNCKTAVQSTINGTVASAF